MQLAVGEEGPCIVRALALVQAHGLKESLAAFSSRTAPFRMGDPAGTLTLTAAPCAAQRFLEHEPEGGLLLLAPSLGLGAGGLLSGLLARGLSPSRLAAFGTRNFSPEEGAFAQRHKGSMFPMRRIAAEGIEEITDAAMERARASRRCHLLVMLDILDPAFAPGISSPSPGGLTTRELLYALQRMRLVKEITSCELVADAREEDDATARVVAKLVAELL